MHTSISTCVYTLSYTYWYVEHTQHAYTTVCIATGTADSVYSVPVTLQIQTLGHPPIHPKVHLHPGFSLTQAQYLPHAEVTGRSACLTWSRIPLWLAPAIPLICVTGPDHAASLHPSLLSSPSSG